VSQTFIPKVRLVKMGRSPGLSLCTFPSYYVKDSGFEVSHSAEAEDLQLREQLRH